MSVPISTLKGYNFDQDIKPFIEDKKQVLISQSTELTSEFDMLQKQIADETLAL